MTPRECEKISRRVSVLRRASVQLADLKASSRAAALQAMEKAALGGQGQGQGLQLHGPSIAGKRAPNVGQSPVYAYIFSAAQILGATAHRQSLPSSPALTEPVQCKHTRAFSPYRDVSTCALQLPVRPWHGKRLPSPSQPSRHPHRQHSCSALMMRMACDQALSPEVWAPVPKMYCIGHTAPVALIKVVWAKHSASRSRNVL